MAERIFPTRHTTLGALQAAGLRLHAFCLRDDCRWHADLDLESLISRLGRDHGAQQPNLVPKLVCSRCGGKEISVVLSATADVPDDTAAYIARRRSDNVE